MIVSIHAPTWGATKCTCRQHPTNQRFNPRTHMGCDGRTLVQSVRLLVSIHAPTWGATILTILLANGVSVSIHAPTWGATQGSCIYTRHDHSFNPRTHMGCDRSHQLVYCRAQVSIHAPTWGATCDSTQVSHSGRVSIHAPTWGATWEPFCLASHVCCFNPRTHMGCDRILQRLFL